MTTQEPIEMRAPEAAPMPTAPVPVPYGAPAPGYAPPAAHGHRRVGKVRSPWGVWGLSLITLGIYQLVWWYKVNRETREFDQRIIVQPGISVLALFVPIASIVSLVKTGGRIGQIQRYAGTSDRCSGGLGFLFAILLGTHVVYYQSQLNKLWGVYGNQPEGTAV